jgi:hypothetical protein
VSDLWSGNDEDRVSFLSKLPFGGLCAAGVWLSTLRAISVEAAESEVLPGHVSAVVSRLTPVGRLAATNHLKLALGLPLRNRPTLAHLIHQLYDPSSLQFGRYLTPEEFTAQFGPTLEDYQAVTTFMKNGGITVTGTHPNRMLVDVEATVADVERLFHVTLRLYRHPTEARTFYAPDAEPIVEFRTPLLHISGLDNLTLPHPLNVRQSGAGATSIAAPRAGSGSNGSYLGRDFRNAYVPGTTLTGTGQTVGLFELSGYFATDITGYESLAGLSAVPLQNVLIDGFNGSAGSRLAGSPNEEVALDIEMAISMAPGLSKVIVYEGSPSATTATINDIFNRMATDNLAKQLSCSWGFDIDATSQQIFLQYAAQGQSCFLASGDSGAFAGVVTQPSDNPFLTVVGGTTLTTDNAHQWVSESTWSGSSGGISSVCPIPDWQQGIDMSANQGSTRMRNVPDVAMVADNVLAIADQGQQVIFGGTSIAAPLWAGFTALVNQRAAALGKPPVGFLNPALYRIGKGSSYTSLFHDITTGNNANSISPNLFQAVPGYDLCTGWGTPTGTNLIAALTESASGGLVVTPALGFLADGPVRGPFKTTSETYTLANAGTAPLNWATVNTASWLNVSPASGSLPPGGTAAVTVTLNSNATNSLILAQTATVSFTDLTTGNRQDRQFAFSSGNGDFETGDFSNWTFSGQPDADFVNSLDASQWYGTTALPGVDDSQFVHAGIYGAFLGQTNTLGFLSQSLPTIPGQQYVISFWLANPGSGTPNQFKVTWNGTVLFSIANAATFAWTNLHYMVSANSSTSVLQFGFRNDPGAFALDDINVVPLLTPLFKTLQRTANHISLTWSALPGLSYQLQSTADPGSGAWANLGDPIATNDSVITVSDDITAQPQRFYRIVLTP